MLWSMVLTEVELRDLNLVLTFVPMEQSQFSL